eukprot:m.18869 g.18869  ORF g.18869 m.18869 type:complete len:112 (-) comp7458_c1_seq1:175-510(-)
MALFVVARRQKTAIFLELVGSDKVLKAVEMIADISKKGPDDVALFYNEKKLNEDKTFTENGVQHDSETPVEPLNLFYVFKKEGADAFEEPSVEKYPEPIVAAAAAAAVPSA